MYSDASAPQHFQLVTDEEMQHVHKQSFSIHKQSGDNVDGHAVTSDRRTGISSICAHAVGLESSMCMSWRDSSCLQSSGDPFEMFSSFFGGGGGGRNMGGGQRIKFNMSGNPMDGGMADIFRGKPRQQLKLERKHQHCCWRI